MCVCVCEKWCSEETFGLDVQKGFLEERYLGSYHRILTSSKRGGCHWKDPEKSQGGGACRQIWVGCRVGAGEAVGAAGVERPPGGAGALGGQWAPGDTGGVGRWPGEATWGPSALVIIPSR